ncbi:YibE/F family protein [Bacillus thuringiensis]|uniref:YibE/F family protein n=1 Tax=Bacillus thuringiensis TaxID=1428 RepID=UPI000CF89616|nr:YibE/F family protein [Bacillus thuringiensis]PQQ47665.1 yibE/F-like family protein [Bacillus thuringiensis]
MTRKQILLYTILLLCFSSSIIFVHHNYSYYERPIAEVMKTKLEYSSKISGEGDNLDKIYTQSVVAQLKNGKEKGHLIHLVNQYSSSGGYDQKYNVGDELFVSIHQNTEKSVELTGDITDVKRDKYVLLIGWVFVFVLLFIGKRQGLFSIISLAINVVLLSYTLDFYLHTLNSNLLLICSLSIILFTFISLLLVNGFNKKTFAAIFSTLLGTFISFLITYLTLRLTAEKGLRYEEMQFLTRPYKEVFMTGVLIGSLGAVMDVAITMSSSIFGLYEENNNISIRALKISGMEIGKDIMGSMTNILFFAYLSGSIPIIILYLKNKSPLGFTLSMNLSLELTRALAGGIGIALTIPIGLYTTIFFINRKRTRL